VKSGKWKVESGKWKVGRGESEKLTVISEKGNSSPNLLTFNF
jgi:hypothetical protein